MAAPSPTSRRSPAPNGFTVGRAAFERISAVEGIEPSAESRDRSKAFDDRGASPEERRRTIIDAHRPRRD